MPESSAKITVDAASVQGELPHPWNYIGYDEINYTYTPQGQDLLAKFGAMQEKPYYVRAHHILCTGNCHGTYKWGSTNVYSEDDHGNPVYDFTIIDLIFDTILKHGLKPFVELAFMPKDLVDPKYYDPQTETRRMSEYRAYGHACPPKDYQKWYQLIYTLVRHAIEKYGEAEVADWYWELWNEPNGKMYWRGTIEEFNQLYDYTAAAVKAASPLARVGGPAISGLNRDAISNQFLDAFLNHCVNGVNSLTGEKGAHLDYISYHIKGGGFRADPLHRPVDPPSTQRLLRQLITGYELIAKYPGLDRLECVLSEADPDGWAAGGAWDNRILNFRNTEYYASYVASAFDKIIRFGQEHRWDVRPLTWAFLFVAERCFEGTRTFSTQGIDKAIFNLFRMFARLGDRQVALASSRAQDPLAYPDLWGRQSPADISGFAALDGETALTALIYSHHDVIELDSETPVELQIMNIPFGERPLTVSHYRIDADHSNAYAEWIRQGRPMYPSGGQYAAIKARDGLELLEPPRRVNAVSGKLDLSFSMPAHSVSLIVVEAI